MWIAWQLEEGGYHVVIQDWDFRPGQNFALQMDKAMAESERTLVVLSPAFLEAVYVQPEWAAAFRKDPTGVERRLISGRARVVALL